MTPGNELACSDPVATMAAITQRPLKRRSKSLPVFPPEPPTMKLSQTGEGVYGEPPDLPSDPYMWTPLHVSLYLSYYLRRYPVRIIDDLSRYVREEARLNGPRLLRLTDAELEDMGMTAKWRKLVMNAVKKVRAERLRGRIWGFGGSGWMNQVDDDTDPNKTLTRKDGRRARASAQFLSSVMEEGEDFTDDSDSVSSVVLQYDALPLDAISTCGTESSVISSSANIHLDEEASSMLRPQTPLTDYSCLGSPDKGQTSLAQYFATPSAENILTRKDLEAFKKDMLEEVQLMLHTQYQQLEAVMEETETRASFAQGQHNYDSCSDLDEEWQQLFSPIWKGLFLVAIGAGLKVADRLVFRK